MPLDTCPHCGADLPEKAKVCPECGSDEHTGWSEDATAQHLDLPDEKFDYDQFIQEEFGEVKPSVRPRGISWLWWAVAIGIVVTFVWLIFGR